jgi:peptide chain release factor subunit 1
MTTQTYRDLDLAALPSLLQTLRVTGPPGGRVLSLYLDTVEHASQPTCLLAFRDYCKALRASLPAAEHEPFEAAVAQIETYLRDDFAPPRPGLAVFAGGRPEYFYATPLPLRPSEELHWGDHAFVEPLETALDDCQRIAVTLFDKERTRLFTIYLGALESYQEFTDYVPAKQATGGWFALAQSRYARHHEDHVLRHAKRTYTALLELLRTHPFDRLLIGGPDEALALLRQRLPRPLRARLAGTLPLELFASDAAVLEAARTAAETLERQDEVKAVTALLEAATTAHAALGLHETLAAVSQGRAYLLFVAEGFDARGGACTVCGQLVGGLDPCPNCGQPTVSLPNLRERLLQRARETDCRVEFVAGEAAALLTARGGIGAWTHY